MGPAGMHRRQANPRAAQFRFRRLAERRSRTPRIGVAGLRELLQTKVISCRQMRIRNWKIVAARFLLAQASQDGQAHPPLHPALHLIDSLHKLNLYGGQTRFQPFFYNGETMRHEQTYLSQPYVQSRFCQGGGLVRSMSPNVCNIGKRTRIRNEPQPNPSVIHTIKGDFAGGATNKKRKTEIGMAKIQSNMLSGPFPRRKNRNNANPASPSPRDPQAMRLSHVAFASVKTSGSPGPA